MTNPKDMPLRSPEDDSWGVGQMADGSIDVFDPSELAARRAQRDAEEQAFDELPGGPSA